MDFRSLFIILRAYIGDPYTLGEAVDSVLANFTATPAPVPNSHDALVNVALRSAAIRNSIAHTKKIQAIKELRTLVPGTGLREAKDAVEVAESILNGYYDERIGVMARTPSWD